MVLWGGGVRGRRAGLRRRPYEEAGGRWGGGKRVWVKSDGSRAEDGRVSDAAPTKKEGRAGYGAVMPRNENTDWPKRRRLRLRHYDYSQAGAYAVTICTQGGAVRFGQVRDGAMQLNAAGRVVERVWHGLPEHYSNVALDVFVVMPDHVHGVIVLADKPLPAELEVGPAPEGVSDGFRPEVGRVSRRHGLSEVVRGFKSFSGRRVNELLGTPGASVWQRGYYEHVARSEEDLNRIREYIVGNPMRWWLRRTNQESGVREGGSG